MDKGGYIPQLYSNATFRSIAESDMTEHAHIWLWGFPGGSLLKSPPANAGGEGNGIPLQYSCLENPMDGGAWWAAVHGVTKSRT